MREAPEPAEQQAAESDEQQALQSSGPSTEAGQRPADQAPSEYRKFCADYPQLGPEAFLYYCVVKHLQQDPLLGQHGLLKRKCSLTRRSPQTAHSSLKR